MSTRTATQAHFSYSVFPFFSPKIVKSNLSLYLLYYAEACNKFTGSFSASLHLRATQLLLKNCRSQGCRNPGGMGGNIPPNNMYPPKSLRMVHICIPSNILNGFASERKYGEKSALFVMRTFFFCFFFGLHLNSGRLNVPFAFFSLVFTKFPHRNKIVVEVHPPQC